MLFRCIVISLAITKIANAKAAPGSSPRRSSCTGRCASHCSRATWSRSWSRAGPERMRIAPGPAMTTRCNSGPAAGTRCASAVRRRRARHRRQKARAMTVTAASSSVTECARGHARSGNFMNCSEARGRGFWCPTLPDGFLIVRNVLRSLARQQRLATGVGIKGYVSRRFR